MNETDFILATVFTIAFLRGALKGFLKTLLGPISLFLGTAISYYIYMVNGNIVLALIIGLFGPFIIHIALGLFAKMFFKAFTSEEKELSNLSRICGGVFSVIWSGTLFLIFILLITLIPLKMAAVTTVQNNIKASKIIQWISEFIPADNKDPVKAISNISQVLQNPQKAEQARQTKSYKNLMKDSSVRDLLSDKETLRQIEEKDFVSLLKNPKIQALMQDPDAMQKLFDFQKELIANASNAKKPSSKAVKKKTEPKVILFKSIVFGN